MRLSLRRPLNVNDESRESVKAQPGDTTLKNCDLGQMCLAHAGAFRATCFVKLQPPLTVPNEHLFSLILCDLVAIAAQKSSDAAAAAAAPPARSFVLCCHDGGRRVSSGRTVMAGRFTTRFELKGMIKESVFAVMDRKHITDSSLHTNKPFMWVFFCCCFFYFLMQVPSDGSNGRTPFIRKSLNNYSVCEDLNIVCFHRAFLKSLFGPSFKSSLKIHSTFHVQFHVIQALVKHKGGI